MSYTYCLVTFFSCWVGFYNLHLTTADGHLRACPPRYSCVPLSHCPRTSTVLHEARDITSLLHLLRLYLCDLRQDGVEVCCHQSFTISPTRALNDDASVESDDQRSTPGNVSIERHPGLNLINQHECGASIKNRIVGGEDTIPGEFPWLALLQYQMSDGRVEFLCGGSLISNRHILTAAHCIPPSDDPFKQLVSVRLGEYNVRSEQDCAMNGVADEEGVMVCASRQPRDYKISSVKTHPNFQNKGVFENDIAVIRLKQRVLIHQQFVVPVCLPVEEEPMEEESLEGSRLEVAGWGVTGSGRPISCNQLLTSWRSSNVEMPLIKGLSDNLRAGLWTSDVLLKVAVPHVARASCERRIRRRLLQSHLCAGGEGGRSPCTGDSGGPLMHTVGGGGRARVCYQVGIVSVAIGSCEATTPGVYTRLRPFMRWILDTMQE